MLSVHSAEELGDAVAERCGVPRIAERAKELREENARIARRSLPTRHGRLELTDVRQAHEGVEQDLGGEYFDGHVAQQPGVILVSRERPAGTLVCSAVAYRANHMLLVEAGPNELTTQEFEELW